MILFNSQNMEHESNTTLPIKSTWDICLIFLDTMFRNTHFNYIDKSAQAKAGVVEPE